MQPRISRGRRSALPLPVRLRVPTPLRSQAALPGPLCLTLGLLRPNAPAAVKEVADRRPPRRGDLRDLPRFTQHLRGPKNPRQARSTRCSLREEASRPPHEKTPPGRRACEEALEKVQARRGTSSGPVPARLQPVSARRDLGRRRHPVPDRPRLAPSRHRSRPVVAPGDRLVDGSFGQHRARHRRPRHGCRAPAPRPEGRPSLRQRICLYVARFLRKSHRTRTRPVVWKDRRLL